MNSDHLRVRQIEAIREWVEDTETQEDLDLLEDDLEAVRGPDPSPRMTIDQHPALVVLTLPPSARTRRDRA
jgi:hypothetical protein